MVRKKWAKFACVPVVLLSVILSTPASAQQNDTKKRLEALEAGQKALQKEIEALKALLVQQAGRTPPPAPTPAAQPRPAAPAPSFAPIAIDAAAVRGNAKARVVLVEFSDFECPFCGRYTRETSEQIVREYVDTGKIRYAFRNFPLTAIHPHAFKAAEAGECARMQGKFWEMRTQLFAHQQALGDTDLVGYARALGLDMPAFQQCVTTAVPKITQELNDGRQLGITGTPAFFIGVLADGKVKTLRRVDGAVPFGQFKAAIDAVLAMPEAK